MCLQLSSICFLNNHPIGHVHQVTPDCCTCAMIITYILIVSKKYIIVSLYKYELGSGLIGPTLAYSR